MLGRARLFGVLFVLAAAVRSIGFPTVFSRAGVQLPYAGDAFFHLRRIWYSVARFPEILDFDRYVSFPDGSWIIWPPAFDWTLAALIRPFVDPSDQQAVESLAAWAPVVLGAATTGTLALMTDRVFGRTAAWCAGLLYVVLPMSFVYSQLGMVDHHVAVAWLTTAMLWSSCEIFARDDRVASWTNAWRGPSVGLAMIAGLVTAATLLTWTGALLHVGVLQLAFGLRWLAAPDDDTARARALQFATFQAVVALCMAPFCLGRTWPQFGSWSPMVLSNFQPVYFFAAAAMVGLAQTTSRFVPLAKSRHRRIATGLALPAAGIAFALLASAPLRDAVASAMGWFGEHEILLRLANEMQPILASRGELEIDFALQRLGAGFFVLPLVCLAILSRAARTRDATRALLVFWALAFLALTLRQWRFGNTLAVVYVVLIGAVLAEWTRGLHRRFSRSPLRPTIEALGVVLLLGWSVSGFVDFYRPIVLRNARAISSEAIRMQGPLVPERRMMDQAGRWLKRNTPRTSGYLDPTIQPEYGVLADWTSGHLLRYRSERPMVQDPFGPYAGRENFDTAWAYFAERDEVEAIRILESLGVRYVVGAQSGAGLTADLEVDAMAHRLATGYGSLLRLRDGRSIPGLSRHRIVYYAETKPPAPRHAGGSAAVLPNLGIWEIVAGTSIEGHATPGAAVHVSLDLTTSRNARHVYRRETRADETGRYRIVVPYPTDVPFSPDVRAARAYRIRSEDHEGRVAVREDQIRSGGHVRGPDLRRTPAWQGRRETR